MKLMLKPGQVAKLKEGPPGTYRVVAIGTPKDRPTQEGSTVQGVVVAISADGAKIMVKLDQRPGSVWRTVWATLGPEKG